MTVCPWAILGSNAILRQKQRVIHSVLDEILLLQQVIARFIRFSNHNGSGNATILAIPITVNYAHSCADGEGRLQDRSIGSATS
jgi:hypothetical protein